MAHLEINNHAMVKGTEIFGVNIRWSWTRNGFLCHVFFFFCLPYFSGLTPRPVLYMLNVKCCLLCYICGSTWLFVFNSCQPDAFRRANSSPFGHIRTQDRQISVLGLAHAVLPTPESSLCLLFLSLYTFVCVQIRSRRLMMNLETLFIQCVPQIVVCLIHISHVNRGRCSLAFVALWWRCCWIPVVMLFVTICDLGR